MKTEIDLRRDVLDELEWDPSIDAAQVGVTVKEGVVTLTGHVPHFAEKFAVEEVAKRVHGVRAVANDIEVRPQESHQRDDTDIAAAAVHALEWDPKVPDPWIQVTVRDGWITLEGSVEHQFEKAAADRAVRRLIGSRGLTNAILVAPGQRAGEPAPRRGDELRADIEAALKRSASVDSRQITVEIESDGEVVLTGDLHSHAELDEAERIAWTARGVARVDNCLTVTPWGSGPADEWGY